MMGWCLILQHLPQFQVLFFGEIYQLDSDTGSYFSFWKISFPCCFYMSMLEISKLPWRRFPKARWWACEVMMHILKIHLPPDFKIPLQKEGFSFQPWFLKGRTVKLLGKMYVSNELLIKTSSTRGMVGLLRFGICSRDYPHTKISRDFLRKSFSSCGTSNKNSHSFPQMISISLKFSYSHFTTNWNKRGS